MNTKPENRIISENKNLSEYDQYYEEARQKLSDAEKSKQDTIKELARKLENSGMPLEKICSEICRNLEGYAAERYIRDCLDEKYKEVKKRNKQAEKDAEVPPHQIEIDTSEKVTNPENSAKETKAEQSPVGQKKVESGFSEIEHKKPPAERAPQNQQTQEEETMQQVIDRYRDTLKRRDEEISRLEDAIKTPKELEPTPLVSGKLTLEKGKEAKDLAFFFMRRSASLTMQDAAHRDIVLDLQTKKLEWGKWEDGGE